MRPAFVHSILVALFIARPAAFAQDDARGLALFKDYVLPLFEQRCYECHSHQAEKAKGGLMLDSANGLLKGGNSGPAIVPGQPGASRLFKAISYQDPDLQMPPKQMLPESDIEHVRQWIALGAPDSRPVENVPVAGIDWEKARGFWSFRKPVKVPFPRIKQPERVRSPIDAFILEKLEVHQLSLRPEADRHTLIRRLYFDLIGLPPAPEEVEGFVQDADPRAYERLVDRLLASPHYGERWGRHWLDVAGFAESSLFIGDVFRPEFWRYRDYVTRAFNEDKPYDQFIVEQLAGDELFDWRGADAFTPDQIEKLVATGFLRCPPDATDNQLITQMEKRYATQQAVVEVSMKALLGLTLNCVRCHTHKYDPIPHEDYYKLVAMFQPAFDPENWLAGIWTRNNPGPVRVIPLLDRPGREKFQRQSETWLPVRRRLNEAINGGGILRRWRDQYLRGHPERIEEAGARDRVFKILGQLEADRSEEDEKFLSALAQTLGIDADFIKKTYPEYEKELQAAKDELEAYRKEWDVLPPSAWAAFDVTSNPSPTLLLHRGNFETPAHEVGPGVITVLDNPKRPFQVPEPAAGRESTGRRLALARWIAQRDHPLTSRVMVNRIWQYHFGAGLVATSDDFGARGARPSHPELLDWLAVEFMERHWSVKHLHRLILNSSTYRQGSRDDDAARAVDPANQWLWRFSPRRLEAEEIRDALLTVAGRLDRTLFGESVPTERVRNGQFQVPANHPGRFRRSVYLSTRRTWVATFLTTFDAPVMDTNWPKRNASAIPQQALALMNNDLVLACAESFARRLIDDGGPGVEQRLNRAFLLAYGRPAEAEEARLLKEFLEAERRAASSFDEAKAWRTICHALLSANEFLYVD